MHENCTVCVCVCVYMLLCANFWAFKRSGISDAKWKKRIGRNDETKNCKALAWPSCAETVIKRKRKQNNTRE